MPVSGHIVIFVQLSIVCCWREKTWACMLHVMLETEAVDQVKAVDVCCLNVIKLITSPGRRNGWQSVTRLYVYSSGCQWRKQSRCGPFVMCSLFFITFFCSHFLKRTNCTSIIRYIAPNPPVEKLEAWKMWSWKTPTLYWILLVCMKAFKNNF